MVQSQLIVTVVLNMRSGYMTRVKDTDVSASPAGQEKIVTKNVT